jgi:hypothetical protein
MEGQAAQVTPVRQETLVAPAQPVVPVLAQLRVAPETPAVQVTPVMQVLEVMLATPAAQVAQVTPGM